VFDALIGRERLGSTGLGHGVAIPHGRLEGNDRTRAAFLQLRDGVDFDSNDRQPVDLLFAMVVPEDSTEEHLKVLARLAEMFSDADFDRRLREAGSAEDLHRLIVDWEAAH
jgi:PTS system nitrogen regulatory IIA component